MYVCMYVCIVDNQLIKECKSTEFLGIVLDQKLTFKNHVLSVSSKLSKSIGILNKINFFFAKKCLNLIYKSICLPYVMYCNVIWASTYPSTTNPIKILMKRAIRTITQSTKWQHTNELFQSTNNFTFDNLHKYLVTIFTYKQLTNNFPTFINNSFSFNQSVRREQYLTTNKSKSNLVYFPIICNGPRTWNELKRSGLKLNLLNSVSLIKMNLKSFLLN